MTAITLFCEDRGKERTKSFRGTGRHMQHWSTRVLWIREALSFVYVVAHFLMQCNYQADSEKRFFCYSKDAERIY